MYPHERSLVEKMKGKPFALIGVNSDKTVEGAKKAVAKNRLNWRSFQNRGAQTEAAQNEEAQNGEVQNRRTQNGGRAGTISETWSVVGWPTVFVLDQEMKIHYRGYDFQAASTVVAGLVAEMTAAGK